MNKIFSITRLSPSGNTRLPFIFRNKTNSNYNICFVKNDATAILSRVEAVESNNENNKQTINDDVTNQLNDVAAIIISPRGNVRNELESDNIIINGKQFVINDDALRDGILIDAALFLPKREVDIDAVEKGRFEYLTYKQRVCIDTIGVVSGVGASLLATGHTQEAAAFAIGGSIGMGVLVQLINQVDNIEKIGFQKILGAARFLMTAAAIGALDHIFASTLREHPGLMIWALLGFTSFRIAILVAAKV